MREGIGEKRRRKEISVLDIPLGVVRSCTHTNSNKRCILVLVVLLHLKLGGGGESTLVP